ncbi:MAG: hypothetical protein ABI134_04780 [Byssovorax sp.]
MAKNTYQTYTDETSIEAYRADFIRRSAMCAAISKRYPDLAAVGAEADASLAQIDTRRANLQQAEDDQVRARAIEDVEKLDVVDAYAELRRTMAAKRYDVLTLLPDAPSTLGRLGAKNFGERANQAVANLKALPDADPLKVTLLPRLQQELAEFQVADLAEDATRANLQSGRVALVVYKAELSQAREIQLGAVQRVLGDREKTAQFTLPWRKAGRGGGEAEAEGTETTAPQGTTVPQTLQGTA